MIKIVISALCFVSLVYGNGELTILHHPASLVFKGHDHVKESILKELYSAALGFSTEQFSNWRGVFIKNPFDLAQAVGTVCVDGVANVGYAKGHHFPLRTDAEEDEVFSTLERRVSERYPESENNLVRIDLSNGLEETQRYSLFKGIKSDKPKKGPHTHLKLAVEEDREFLQEIALFNAVLDKIEENVVKSDNVPDVFWFRFVSLHALRDLYGENSTQVKEAKHILNEAVVRMNNIFVEIYNSRVLISVIASDAVHTRRTRNILADDVPVAPLNIARVYNPNYPVIFNIILWFGVTMFFTLLAICIALGTMDPGRDSIIYRMTSTRMKKDN